MMTRAPFKLFSSALFASFLVVNCVVSTEDDADDEVVCNAGDTRECECESGQLGTQQCRSDETGYAACSCSSPGGAGGGGGTSGAGTSGSAGAGAAPVGEGGAGGQSTSGGAAGSPGAGAGGISGEGGGAGEGQAGSGGEGGTLSCDELVGDPPNPCDQCTAGQCCAELVACLTDDVCADEFFFISECVEGGRDIRTVPPSEARDCAEAVSGDSWPSGLAPETVALWNCMAGDTSDPTWVDDTAWAANSCRDGCFSQIQ